MSQAVNPLFQWLHAHPHLAGLATFIISAGESVAIIGTIVPGSIMMTAIGTLAGAGVIPLWSTIIWAILGAIAGDGISYWIGYYFKDRLPYVWPFKNYPGVLTSGERFFYKYGAMSVFIGRFVGPVRALVPLVAGMLGMRPLVFTIANVASAIGWAPAYMLPGIVLGAASLELPPDIAIHVMLMLLLMGLLILLCLWFVYKLFQLIHSQVTALENRIWRRLEQSRYFHHTTIILKHHDPYETHGQFSLALFLILTLFLLTALIVLVKTQGVNTILVNEVVYHLFRGLSNRSPEIDGLMLRITLLGQKQILGPALVIVGIWMFLTKNRRVALHVFALGVLTAGSIYIIKHIIKIPRPWGIFYNPESFSMPSGHTTLAATFYLGLALLMCQSIQGKFWRKTIYSMAALIAIAVSISRLYLGAHWFTDIIAGWLLSAALLMFITISYQRKLVKPVNYFALLIISILSIAICYSIFYVRNIHKLETMYIQERWPVSTIQKEQWWQNDGFLAGYRTSVFGYPSQKINVQWVGNLDAIRQSLMQQGWTKPPARDLISTLHRIADVSSTEYLPLISPQYLDRRPELVLIRLFDNKPAQLVLRLWDSHKRIAETGDTLYVGVVGFIPRSYNWLFYRPNNLRIAHDLIFPNRMIEPAWESKIIVLSIGRSKRKNNEHIILLIRPKNQNVRNIP